MASEVQPFKVELPVPPLNLTSQDYRSGWHDMTDCNEAAYYFVFGTVSNTYTQIGILGSDDGGSTFGTVAAYGAFGGSVADLPTGTNADNQVVAIYTKDHKKQHRVIIGAGASNNLTACLLVKKLKESPATATDRGLLAQIIDL